VPTLFHLRNLVSDINPGANVERYLLQRKGRASTTKVTNTTASGTNITVTDTAGGTIVQWYSAPLRTAVTISGTVTASIRGLESATTVNAGVGFLVERVSNDGTTVLGTIVADSTIPATITEFSTSDAAKTGTYTPTSTAMSVGDRIRVTLKIRNVGTMGTGTATISIEGPSDTGAGGSYVQFNEDIITDDPIDEKMIGPFQSGGYYQ
jgi:hypothetical protein